ncbi:hypothetical protein K9M79_05040 [Candidatus Woesearchaeota archaeon]|nr:hypothetical protein [Candidatus Woesearchaeota archaeon]
MRIITIKVSAVKNGEEANIAVSHSSDGKRSKLELENVMMLNEFLYMKVDELSCPQDQKLLSEYQFQQNELAN